MNEKLLPWLLLFCALGLSSTAAYYSVSGLATIFTGVTIPIIIMGGFLELSKVVTATYLHNSWKTMGWALKGSLTIMLLCLMLITSLGIYGLLSKGFQENISGLEIDTKRIKNIEVKKERFIETKSEYIVEKENSNKDVSQLRESLANGTMTQYKDRETGEIITVRSSSARKVFEEQLELALENRSVISLKIESLNDSITNLDLKVLDMQIESETESELGVIKYVSEITGISIKEVANFFILILIFVFDPLAILLVIATNQKFKNLRKKKRKNMYGETKIMQDPTYESPIFIQPNVDPIKPIEQPPIKENIQTPTKPIENMAAHQDSLIENQIHELKLQIHAISSASSSVIKNRGVLLAPLNAQLKDLQYRLKESSKEY